MKSYLITIFAVLSLILLVAAQDNNKTNSANAKSLPVSQQDPLITQKIEQSTDVPTSEVSQAPSIPVSADGSAETPDGLIYYGGYPYAPYYGGYGYGNPYVYKRTTPQRKDVPASEVSHAVPAAGSEAGPDGLIYYGGAPYSPFYGSIPYYGNPWVYKRGAPKASPANVPVEQVSQAPSFEGSGSTETPDGLIYYGGYPYAPYYGGYGYGNPYVYKRTAAKKQAVPINVAASDVTQSPPEGAAAGSEAGPDGLIYYGGAPYSPFYGSIPYYGNPWVYKRSVPQAPRAAPVDVPAAEVSQAPTPEGAGSGETPEGLIYYGGFPYAPYYGAPFVYGKKQA